MLYGLWPFYWRPGFRTLIRFKCPPRPNVYMNGRRSDTAILQNFGSSRTIVVAVSAPVAAPPAKTNAATPDSSSVMRSSNLNRIFSSRVRTIQPCCPQPASQVASSDPNGNASPTWRTLAPASRNSRTRTFE